MDFDEGVSCFSVLDTSNKLVDESSGLITLGASCLFFFFFLKQDYFMNDGVFCIRRHIMSGSLFCLSQQLLMFIAWLHSFLKVC